MNARLPSFLNFEGTDLTIIDREGKPWLSAADLAKALGYSDTRRLSVLFYRHKDEFTDDMTQVIDSSGAPKLSTAENNDLGKTGIRIFSPRGCHLIAMLSRTNRAKTFRQWVLNVLENLQQPQSLPPMETIGPKTKIAIEERAQSLTLRQFNNLKHRLKETAKRYIEEKDLDDDQAAKLIRRLEMPDSQWLMIERHRLWQLTHELGEIAKSAQYAMEKVQELEEETGVRLWSR